METEFYYDLERCCTPWVKSYDCGKYTLKKLKSGVSEI